MKYVDGFVFVVHKDKVQNYINMASKGRDIWMKHGARAYYECKGEDFQPNTGGEETTSFPVLMNASQDETIWFSFIIFDSKEHRDEVNSKVMADPEMSPEAWEGMEMPFDMKRLSYAGFDVVVN